VPFVRHAAIDRIVGNVEVGVPQDEFNRTDTTLWRNAAGAAYGRITSTALAGNEPRANR